MPKPPNAFWSNLTPLRENGWEFDIKTNLWTNQVTGETLPTRAALERQAEYERQGRMLTWEGKR